MEPLIDHLGKPLIWSQVKFRRFELLARDRVLARLEWQKVLSSIAIGETADGRWTLKREGWFRPCISVTTADGDVPVAALKFGGRGRDTIRMASGTSFVWRATKVHRSEMGIFGAEDTPLVTLRLRQKLLRYEAAVTIAPAARRLAELPVLLLLGWYRMAQGLDEESALMAAIAGAATAYSGT